MALKHPHKLICILNDRNFRLISISVVTIVLAVLLMFGLIRFTRADLNEITRTIADMPLWGIALFFAMTLLNLMLGAKKWQLVVEHLSRETDEMPSYSFFLLYTLIGAFLGLFVPIQVSTLATRSISLQVGGYGSVKRGAASSIISQVQDVIVIIIFVIPGYFVIFRNLSFSIWILEISGLIIGGHIFFRHILPFISEKVANQKISNKWPKSFYGNLSKNIISLFQEISNKKIIAPSLTIPLYYLSMLRFINLALRSYLISWLIGLGVSPISIMSMSSITQLSLLIAITPGNLGVLEWGWVGLLGLVDIPIALAGNFALTTRTLGYGSTITIFVISFLYLPFKVMHQNHRQKI